MKKVLIVFLVLVLILSMSGCGVKKKIENKIGEAIGDKIIEGATGQKVDVKVINNNQGRGWFKAYSRWR